MRAMRLQHFRAATTQRPKQFSMAPLWSRKLSSSPNRIQDALSRAFKDDDRIRVLGFDELRAGDRLIPASKRNSSPVLASEPTISNAVTVVKLFLRTVGEASSLPHPTAGTDVGMEIWLPSDEAWNGRIRAQIQGGFAGDFRITSTNHFSLPALTELRSGQIASDLGYVVALTDGGHVADTYEDERYLLNEDGSKNTQGWKNIAWQATHLLGDLTKRPVKAYYGQPARASYLYGCSTGGRAAYHSAQKFPDDFDGLLIGCPSITQSLLFPSLIHPHIVIQNDLDGKQFTSEQLEMVSRKALAAGDTAITGEHDGYSTDWENNRYDPGKDPSILSYLDGGKCTETHALSRAQCQAINKIWYGPTFDGSAPDPAEDNGAGVNRPSHQLWWGKIRGTRISFAQEPRQISGSHLAVALGDRSLADSKNGDPLARNAWKSWTYEEYAQAMLKCREMDASFETWMLIILTFERFNREERRSWFTTVSQMMASLLKAQSSAGKNQHD